MSLYRVIREGFSGEELFYVQEKGRLWGWNDSFRHPITGEPRKFYSADEALAYIDRWESWNRVVVWEENGERFEALKADTAQRREYLAMKEKSKPPRRMRR